MARTSARLGTQALKQTLRTGSAPRKGQAAALASQGDWVPGLAMAPTGVRRYHLFKPPGVQFNERLPLVVMLHGCGQDAKSFALSTRMNRLAARERFFVLYPEQDRRAHPHGCWNWYGTRTHAAHGEAAVIMAAIDQVCLLYPVDPARVVIAGMSAGASMAALLVTRYPQRFKAVAMHSGVPPGTANSSASALVAMRGRATAEALSTSTVWPPLLVIHGARDAIVDARNARASAKLWADAAGPHAEKSRRVGRGKRHPMTVTDFKVRGGITVATLCEVDELAHAWSGGDARQSHSDARGPDASRLIWSFAQRQFTARARRPTSGSDDV
ncbi:MAG: PHB depolymerase family esterase [Rubrivivax sp.]|nr:MAG: PHB depolymerase family esterase [Rubrivivax sp.]